MLSVAARGCRVAMKETPHPIRRVFNARLLRFGVQTVVSFGLNVGITVGLHELMGVRESVAFAVALAVVFVVNFLSLRYFVYRAADGHGGKQLTMFAVSTLVFRGGEWVAFYVIHDVFAAPPYPTLIGVLFASFVVKYFYYGFVFRSRAATAGVAAA